MIKHHIVLVEDDEELATLTSDFFNNFEFECTIVSHGREAIKKILELQPEVVLLDLMLPDIDGIQVFQTIKGQFSGKVVMLTARGGTTDQVMGLEIGADDYISKPIEPRLLLAKVRALLRREEKTVEASTPSNKYELVIGDFTINTHKREVKYNNAILELTTLEYELLVLLIKNSGEIVTRDTIYESLWGHDYDGQNRQVDIYISYIRSKIEQNGGEPSLIKTVRSKGYIFVG
jgi:two-component system response regulator RstA